MQVLSDSKAIGNQARIDVVFPALHGTYGEDGTIQGLLDMANLPYVGAGVLGSSVGMDKDVMKRLLQHAGLPIVDFLVVLDHQWQARKQAFGRTSESQLGYPCFVKPANLGSSVGISKVKNAAALDSAMDLAAQYDRKIIIEKGLEVREIECSVLGNDDPLASLPGEIVPSHEFYDYEAKYLDESSRLLIPAPLEESQTKTVQELAIRTFLVTECSGLARVDFFLEKKYQPHLCERNQHPAGIHLHQHVSQALASHGAWLWRIDRQAYTAGYRAPPRHANPRRPAIDSLESTMSENEELLRRGPYLLTVKCHLSLCV